MPAMSAFGRKWNLATDDFVFPGISMLIVRTVWLFVIVGTLIQHDEHFDNCEDSKILKSFYYGMLVLLPLKIGVNIGIIHFSRQGSITNHGLRRNVPKILYVKFILFLLELIWLVIGAVWSFHEYYGCDTAVVMAVRVITMLSWLGALVFIIMMLFLMSPLGHAGYRSANSQVWKNRCQYLCCSFKPDAETNDTYREVAELISQYFSADEGTDLVPTDIAAGLILLSRRRSLNKESFSGVTVINTSAMYDRHQARDLTDNPASSLSNPPANWMTINRAERMMTYSLASYGWPLYSYMHFPHGCCIVCCASPRKSVFRESDIIEDNICGCNLTAVDKIIKNTNSTIHYASFHNSLYNNPFMIIIDDDYKSVIVTIRGTLSFKDALVDISAMGEIIDPSLPSTYMAHKGMLKAAHNLRDKLKHDNLLRSAFDGLASDYTLVICGHSLGAGVGSLLTLLLQSEFDNVQCYAFSPPGGLLSEEAAISSARNTMSVIIGDDLVPRLAIHSMEDLRVNVIQEITSSNKPKYKIFGGAGLKAISCCKTEDSSNQPLVSSRQSSYSEGFSNDRATNESHDISRISQIPFYPPGAIMYITDDTRHSFKCSCCVGDKRYSWRWANYKEFNELIISPRMLGDHLPDTVLAALRDLTSDYPDQIVHTNKHITVTSTVT